MPLAIKWNKHAFSQLIKAIEYIEKDSPQNAEKVKAELITTISKLAINPELFSRGQIQIK
ncbi:MAG: type II toxin-antitoxin system RelE/ParE family toxin [Ginsengibacter sp.]